VQKTVGEAIAQALPAPKPPSAPVEPAPAPRPAAPAPRAVPPPAVRSAAPAPAAQASTARATPGADASSGQAVPRGSEPAPPRVARAARGSGTPDAAEPSSRVELVAAGDLVADAGEENPSTLPFTGLPLLPLMAVAALMLLAGTGLRRVVQ
jgi:hypothetical protein